MKAALASMALSATAASLASAFVGSPLPLRASMTKPSCSARTGSVRVRPSKRMAMAADEDVDDDTPKVYYASEVTDGNVRTKLNNELGEQPLSVDTTSDENDNFGPVDYKGFVDGEGFDGGDGQVGCVGDGSNAMEQFDTKAVGQAEDMRAKLKSSTFVKESKSRQRNAWGGGNTGYAESLKEKGMVKTNLQGEDITAVRRQQFENYRNQQEITSQQRAKVSEMDKITGVGGEDVDGPKWKKGRGGYFDNMNTLSSEGKDEDWNTYSAPATTGKKDGTVWAETNLTGNEKIEGTTQCVSLSGRPGHASVEVKNTVMTYEPFHCSFKDDAKGFAVAPIEGTLNRRGGKATVLDVSFKGKGPGDNQIGTLIVETEEDTWIYKIEGSTQ